MRNSQGQVILLLILVMTVALAIGLSVIQRSLSDISTSSKVEQSARAFSAAEAGIEKALRNDFSGASLPDASSTVTGGGLIPEIPPSGSPQIPLEYPALSKEEVAQVWLADPDTLTPHFDRSSIDIAWGNSIQNAGDKPAIEISQIYSVSGSFSSQKFYFDSDSARASTNRFTDASANCLNPVTVSTTMGPNRNFYCRTTLSGLTGPLKLLRVRMLYSNTSQAFTVISPHSGCSAPDKSCYLPPQARIIQSTGSSGATQRKLQLFQLYKVVPPYFDYAIFSAGEINK